VNISVLQVWGCPNCGAEYRSSRILPNRFHVCPKLRYLTAPMVPAGTRAKVELREREDYVNGDTVQLDPELGRPVMSIVTTRDTGQDCVVLAPAATAKGA
jgi:hypothetical protein